MENPIILYGWLKAIQGRLQIPKAQQETKGAKTGHQGSL